MVPFCRKAKAATFWLFFFAQTVFADVRCKDEAGQPIDWYIAYKLPYMPGKDNGLSYFYMDNRRPAFAMSQQGDGTLDGKGSLAFTLAPLYSIQQKEDVAYALYNDEPPNGAKSEYRGHTKGVVAFDGVSGFWLIQSTPKFPPTTNSDFSFPESEAKNGQIFFCVSFLISEFSVIARQLQYNYPLVYDSNFPPALRSIVPSFGDVLSGEHVKSKPYFNTVEVTSATGQKFVSFAKYSLYNVSIYDGIIAPYFRDGLKTETWQNGIGKMASNCISRFHVRNVVQVQLGTFTFPSTKDHAKWTITNSLTWVCIGDLNRQVSQNSRAGGAMCFDLSEVWSAFNKTAINVEEC